MTRAIKSACVKASAIAVAAVAASATFTANANTTRNWIGGTGTADAPKDLWDYANWDGEGNFYVIAHDIGASAFCSLWNLPETFYEKPRWRHGNIPSGARMTIQVNRA